MLIPGHATAEGTARFRDRFARKLPGHFRQAYGLWLSSIGLGTYLGEPTAASDLLYRDAVTHALELGTNVIDSAVNYRHQRSERAIGQAVAASISEGKVLRDELFLATKGCFLSFDGEEPRNPSAYFEQKLIASGLVEPEDVAAGCHVMSPKYLENQIDVSRTNLGVETIDLYYLHNPEIQLGEVGRKVFYQRLIAAFETLERAVQQNKVRCYGTATWNAYRVSPGCKDWMPLEEVWRAAEDAGGKDHHFCAVQLPLNLAMPEALAASTQPLDGKSVPLLRVAQGLGLMVFASASLLQGRLAGGLPPEITRHFQGLKTDAQRAIQFVRSTPAVTCALVGMSKREHVEENLATAAVPPLAIGEFSALFS
jgi:aryl-alcohol dehydrogenase-like predicted oxidoreductase